MLSLSESFPQARQRKTMGMDRIDRSAPSVTVPLETVEKAKDSSSGLTFLIPPTFSTMRRTLRHPERAQSSRITLLTDSVKDS